MAKDSAKELSVIFQKRFDKKFSQTRLNNAGKKMGKLMVELNRYRVQQGINTDGRRFKKLSKQYIRFKKNYIAGRLSSKARKRLGRATKWQAKGVPNYGRLTGQLFTDLKYQVFSFRFFYSFFDTLNFLISFLVFLLVNLLHRMVLCYNHQFLVS